MIKDLIIYLILFKISSNEENKKNYSLFQKNYDIYKTQDTSILHLYNLNIKGKKKLNIYERINLEDYPKSKFIFVYNTDSYEMISVNLFDENKKLIAIFENQQYKYFEIIPKKSGLINFEFTNKIKTEIHLIAGFHCLDCKKNNSMAKDSQLKDSLKILNKLSKKNNEIFRKHEKINNIQLYSLKDSEGFSMKMYSYNIIEILSIIILNVIQIFMIKKMLKNQYLI